MAEKSSPDSPTARGLDSRALAYTASIAFDRRLYRHDIAASIAHARMLARQGIIPGDDAKAIVRGLEEIRAEIEGGEFAFRRELEDIHLNIEARLKERSGEAAGRLHTARSRNDQIATDMRLYVMEACDDAGSGIKAAQAALLALAEANRDVIMPGYTHLQRAQPLLLAHHLLAYFEMLERDKERFADCRGRADALPLGSGALAGVPYPIDRESVARDLGFSLAGFSRNQECSACSRGRRSRPAMAGSPRRGSSPRCRRRRRGPRWRPGRRRVRPPASPSPTASPGSRTRPAARNAATQ